VIGEPPSYGIALQSPEGVFAVVEEDVRDGLAGELLDVVVGVAEGNAEAFGGEATDGGLAGAGGPDEDEDRRGHRMVRLLR
jgi:hypothetical protein